MRSTRSNAAAGTSGASKRLGASKEDVRKKTRSQDGANDGKKSGVTTTERASRSKVNEAKASSRAVSLAVKSRKEAPKASNALRSRSTENKVDKVAVDKTSVPGTRLQVARASTVTRSRSEKIGVLLSRTSVAARSKSKEKVESERSPRKSSPVAANSKSRRGEQRERSPRKYSPVAARSKSKGRVEPERSPRKSSPVAARVRNVSRTTSTSPTRRSLSRSMAKVRKPVPNASQAEAPSTSRRAAATTSSPSRSPPKQSTSGQAQTRPTSKQRFRKPTSKKDAPSVQIETNAPSEKTSVPPAASSAPSQSTKRKRKQVKQTNEDIQPPQKPVQKPRAQQKRKLSSSGSDAEADVPKAEANQPENNQQNSNEAQPAATTPPQVQERSEPAASPPQQMPPPAPRRHQPKISLHPYLPSKDLLPLPTDTDKVVKDRLQRLRNRIRDSLCSIFNQVQDSALSVDDGFKIIEKIYDFYLFNYGNCDEFDAEDTIKVAKRYRNMIIYVLYNFGPVVWKILNNPGIQKVKELISKCIESLGWVHSTRRNKIKPFTEWKYDRCFPAAYYMTNLYVKYHTESNTFVRQTQLQILQRLVELADASNNQGYLEHVYEIGHVQLLIRLKDKHTGCRIAAMSILSKLVKLPGAEESLIKELKYYTRFDPSTEVRRLGTIALKDVERLRLRFFFDQAFDRCSTVRFEAFKAMGMERKQLVDHAAQQPDNNGEQGDEEAEVQNRGPPAKQLLRDMNQLSNERLCKLVLWGTTFSDSAKCSNFVKSELLAKWLKLSCENDLVKFLTNFDGFSNMKSVIKILDMMISSSDRFVEDLDLKFIQTLQENIKVKNFKSVSIEGMIAWLSICKASSKFDILRKYVPDSTEMVVLLESLHKMVTMEHNAATAEERTEEAGPIVAVVVGLGVCRFVTWEEATRRQMQNLIKEMLLDPLLDERMVVIEGMTVLQMFCEKNSQEFEDLMMEVFQDIFDADNDTNRARRLQNESASKDGNSAAKENSVAGSTPSETARRQSMASTSSSNLITPQPSATPVQPSKPQPTLPTLYSLTMQNDKLCGLLSHLMKLKQQKEDIIKDKRFTDAMPVIAEIEETKAAIDSLKLEIAKSQEALERAKNLPKPSEVNQTNSPQPGPSSAITPAARQSLALNQNVQAVDLMEIDREEEDEDEPQQPRVITSLEEGLNKALFMINGYMELCPKINSFIRNLYDNHILMFFTQEQDVCIRSSVVQFLTRIALAEKKELRKVSNICITILATDNVEVDLMTIAFKGLVDLLMVYGWKDFMLTENELEEDDTLHPYKADFTKNLQKILQTHEVTYETVTAAQMRKFFIALLTSRYYPPNKEETIPSPTTREQIKTLRNQGLLKLFVRGRIQDPYVISNILLIWANVEFSGTQVLRDLESVLKCYGSFGWWDPEDRDPEEFVSFVEGEEEEVAVVEPAEGEQPQENQQEQERSLVENVSKEGNRVLGTGFALAVIKLSEPPVNRDRDDDIVLKFVSYMLGFLNTKDQPLMRSIITRILNAVEKSPFRSFNTMLIRAASKIPVTNHVSARNIMRMVNNIVDLLKAHPTTSSLTATKKELKSFVKKYQRIFGDEIALIEDGPERSRIIGDDIEFFDDEDQQREPNNNELDDQNSSSSNSSADDNESDR